MKININVVGEVCCFILGDLQDIVSQSFNLRIYRNYVYILFYIIVFNLGIFWFGLVMEI